MMIPKAMFAVAVALSFAVSAVTAHAQTQSCQCDCYFSSDCPGSTSCDYGSLSVEDSCFWRSPKPQGSPGAGCTENFIDWGQCDGVCTGVAQRSMYTDEDISALQNAAKMWGRAFDSVALRGGGLPDPAIIQQVEELGFIDDRVPDGMGRIVGELLMLSRGPGFIEFPHRDAFVWGESTVADLRSDPVRANAGKLTVQALIKEIAEPGTGESLVRQIPDTVLHNNSFLQRVCEGQRDFHACLHERVADMGELLGRGGRDDFSVASAGGSGFPPCAMKGDFDNDGDVDMADYEFLAPCLYGAQVLPPPDPGTTEDDKECMSIFDFDGDSDIDLLDCHKFMLLYNVPG